MVPIHFKSVAHYVRHIYRHGHGRQLRHVRVLKGNAGNNASPDFRQKCLKRLRMSKGASIDCGAGSVGRGSTQWTW